MLPFYLSSSGLGNNGAIEGSSSNRRHEGSPGSETNLPLQLPHKAHYRNFSCDARIGNCPSVGLWSTVGLAENLRITQVSRAKKAPCFLCRLEIVSTQCVCGAHVL